MHLARALANISAVLVNEEHTAQETVKVTLVPQALTALRGRAGAQIPQARHLVQTAPRELLATRVHQAVLAVPRESTIPPREAVAKRVLLAQYQLAQCRAVCAMQARQMTLEDLLVVIALLDITALLGAALAKRAQWARLLQALERRRAVHAP